MIRIRSLPNIKYNVVTLRKRGEGGGGNKCTANGVPDRHPYIQVHPSHIGSNRRSASLCAFEKKRKKKEFNN